MDYKFSKKEKEFMQIALNEAEKSLKRGDFPVGVLLVINGKVIDKLNNDSLSSNKWISHAEMKLFNRYSALIKKSSMNGLKVELYTTLEPCLMCFGVAIHHRLSKIVYACPDPNAGSTHINPLDIKEFYFNMWPKVFGGLMKEKSYKMMLNFLNAGEKEQWKQKSAKLFANMGKMWK